MPTVVEVNLTYCAVMLFRIVPKKTQRWLATRSAKGASYDVKLDRSTESQHRASRKSVCVRVFSGPQRNFSTAMKSQHRASRKSVCVRVFSGPQRNFSTAMSKCLTIMTPFIS
ncbi:hypothetical protein T265_13003, partial [Opisthorchis viverrini]